MICSAILGTRKSDSSVQRGVFTHDPMDVLGIHRSPGLWAEKSHPGLAPDRIADSLRRRRQRPGRIHGIGEGLETPEATPGSSASIILVFPYAQ